MPTINGRKEPKLSTASLTPTDPAPRTPPKALSSVEGHLAPHIPSKRSVDPEPVEGHLTSLHSLNFRVFSGHSLFTRIPHPASPFSLFPALAAGPQFREQELLALTFVLLSLDNRSRRLLGEYITQKVCRGNGFRASMEDILCHPGRRTYLQNIALRY